jgi:hypothetical protein
MARPPRSDEGLFDCWEIERAWDVTETGVTRARDQVIKRFIMLELLDLARATREKSLLMQEAKAELQANIAEWQRKQEEETRRLEKFKDGRANRCDRSQMAMERGRSR